MAKSVFLLADAAEDPKRFKSLFATGAAPSDKERRRYVEGMYIVLGIQPRSDAEAEVRVKVIDGKEVDRGEATWTVVKEEGRWKLKSAPLP